MAKTRTNSDQIKLALERLLRDEEVQGHLRTAAARLQEAGARATARRPSKAVEDKKLYGKLREAATSLTKAGRSLRAEREPSRRGRKLALLLVVGAGLALALKTHRSQHTDPPPAQSFSDDAPTPAAAPLRPVSA